MSARPGTVRRALAALAGLAVAAALAAAGWQGYRAVAAQPVKRVVFAGDLDRLPQDDLEALGAAIQAAGRSATLEAIRASARRVPWVRDATVRREFPGTVVITFQAHQALARWDDARLVSRTGEVFAARDAAKLPRLRGPEGSAARLAVEYPRVAAALAPIGEPVEELRLSARGAWSVVLASGLTLQLGRGDVLQRLERFAAAWPRLIAQGVRPDYVDLRYPNGFAVRRAAVLTVTPAQGLTKRGGARR